MKKAPGSTSKEKKDYWFKHILLWQNSQLTQKRYCQQENLNPSTFIYWRTKFLKMEISHSPTQDTDKASSVPTLVPIQLKQPEPAAKPILCTLNLSNGFHLAIHDLQALSFILEKVK